MFDIHSFANWSRIDCKACKERAACDQVPYECPLDEPPLKYPRIIKESGYTAYFMEIRPLGMASNCLCTVSPAVRAAWIFPAPAKS